MNSKDFPMMSYGIHAVPSCNSHSSILLSSAIEVLGEIIFAVAGLMGLYTPRRVNFMPSGFVSPFSALLTLVPSSLPFGVDSGDLSSFASSFFGYTNLFAPC